MQNGITLIALVITIIILLILAGVTISLVLGNNGILNRAEDSVIITKIKEIEEFARLSYADRQIDEILEGKEATMAGVISDLKEEGYTIKQEAENGNNITASTIGSLLHRLTLPTMFEYCILAVRMWVTALTTAIGFRYVVCLKSSVSLVKNVATGHYKLQLDTP